MDKKHKYAYASSHMVISPDEAITEAELTASRHEHVRPGRMARFMRILGPGIITGAADDDPSGIATYSQAGAQFGFAMPWVMLFCYPLMTAVQESCARIGAVTGKGLAAVVREYYPRWVLYLSVGLVVFANTLNIGSDLGAMAAATQLVLPLPFPVLAIFFALFILLLEVFVAYKTYVKILKWLVLALAAYFLTALVVGVPWGEALKATFTPQIQLTPEFLYIIVAILGTTISPYLFFWQTSEVVEDEIAAHRLAQRGGVPRLSKKFIKELRIDNAFGMAVSNITAWFIMIVGAVVLHRAGITNIESAADAAKALEPLVAGFPHAGYIAKLIFAIGVVGLGLLAVPVLAGSCSYAVSEVFGWKEGLFRPFKQARAFYLVIIAATLAGLAINFIGIDPIKALVFTAVFNGIAAVPLIFLLARISSRRDILGEYTSGRWSKAGLWTAWLVMTVAAVSLLLSFALGS